MLRFTRNYRYHTLSPLVVRETDGVSVTITTHDQDMVAVVLTLPSYEGGRLTTAGLIRATRGGISILDGIVELAGSGFVQIGGNEIKVTNPTKPVSVRTHRTRLGDFLNSFPLPFSARIRRSSWAGWHVELTVPHGTEVERIA
jgi:hypothetical protein